MKTVDEITRPLFLGMTRPPMLLGVTFNYFVINTMTSMITFLGTGELPWVLIAIPFHIIGYLICLHDPNMFEVLAVKLLKMMQCLNRSFWGGLNSYCP